MGLPILSLTFRRSPFRVRTRVEMVVDRPLAALPAALTLSLRERLAFAAAAAMASSEAPLTPMLLLKNGFAQKKPSSRTVPTYLPKRMHTRAWPGCSEKKPFSGKNQKQKATMLIPMPQP